MADINLRAQPLNVFGTVDDDVTITLTVVDANGDPIDVSGYTIQADVWRGSTSVVTFTDAVSGASNNVITLSLTDTQTGTVGSERKLRWSLSMTSGGITEQWVAGKFELVEAGHPKASGVSSATITYTSGNATVTLGSISTTALDARYAQQADANFFTDPASLKWGPADELNTLEVRSTGDDGRSLFELGHGGTEGYIFHLISDIVADGVIGGAALIGLGVGEGGQGLFVNNYKNGIGIAITNRSTTNKVHSYGLLIANNSTLAPGAYMTMAAADAAPAAVFVANTAPNAGTKLVRWLTTVSTTADTEMGYIDPEAQKFVWNTTIEAGAALRARSSSVTPKVSIINEASASGSRWIDMQTTFGIFTIAAKGNSGTGGTGDILAISHTTKNLGVGGFNSFGSATGGAVGLPNSTAPSGTPSGGGVLYVESGALKYKGSSGTVTTLGPA